MKFNSEKSIEEIKIHVAIILESATGEFHLQQKERKLITGQNFAIKQRLWVI